MSEQRLSYVEAKARLDQFRADAEKTYREDDLATMEKILTRAGRRLKNHDADSIRIAFASQFRLS